MTGRSAGLRAIVSAARVQASSADFARAVRSPSSLSVRSLRSPITWSLVSVTAVNTPPTPPLSSRMGL